EPYSDLFVLAGSKAWQAWGKGKGEEWLLLCSLVDGLESNQKPVILGENQLDNISSTRIAKEDQQLVKIAQYGELKQEEITAICQNLAKNTSAREVKLIDSAAQLKEDLSSYIQLLRTDKKTADLATQLALPEKVKENDGVNKKARALTKSLEMDLALNPRNRELYNYDGIGWQMVEKYEFLDKVVAFFEEQDFGYSARSIEGIIDTIKIQVPKMGVQTQELIAFNNGTLNRTTLEFLPHYRKNWLTSYIPHDYLNSAQNTPHFDKWLDFVSGGKESKKNAILAALYVILTNRNDWQLFFEVTGDGGSGKSVFANIATLLAGEQNTESGRLVDLDEPRGRESFVGKTLLICPEQSRYGGDGGGLKSITGGDPVNIDPKHRSKFKAVIPAVVLIVNNEATRFTERSGGIERRRVIFHFDKVVPENERDPNFMDKIEGEVGGIIYKLIHTFEQPETAKAALKEQQTSDEALEIKSESDHITEFCGYFYTAPQNDGLYIGNANLEGKARTHLYPAYLAFSRASGITNTLTLRNFSNSLKQGFAQHKNKFEFSKIKGKYGYRSNVHFKNYDEFQNEFNS
ncbi:phage/plasmid primase, P4 family, partial [uncultured Haemophilus sp.]|uniref:DNA primase family protein n=1 Tax=uncultured Haemophilus sp. TaxID=237779 RepID=UPI00258C41D3